MKTSKLDSGVSAAAPSRLIYLMSPSGGLRGKNGGMQSFDSTVEAKLECSELNDGVDPFLRYHVVHYVLASGPRQHVPMPGEVNYFVFKDGKYWIGQCLEVDICAQSKTRNGVDAELRRILATYACLSRDSKLERLKNEHPEPPEYMRCFANLLGPECRGVIKLNADGLPRGWKLPKTTAEVG